MQIDMISVGHRIKQRRQSLNLTQTDIYKKCGVASGALSQIENGTRTPSIIIFYKLAQTLECSMDWLLTGASTNSETESISENEERLLAGFHKLPDDEKQELLEILELKLRKLHKARTAPAKSSHSQTIEGEYRAG